ncbi:transmembrane protein 134 isoform X10 [Rattus norvegicus]|uniref:transmembrane protein 134 isoform X10 n=1 Tax=Rattus norvegicus TaxID=10116 RepID=UPI0019171BFB|nr:transmembrane protein 134 isoform X5 [Rattus norvegicus]
MSAARPQFSIDDAFELTLEDAGPGPESSGVARFGPLHFDRRARFEVTDEEKQSRLRYQHPLGPRPHDLWRICIPSVLKIILKVEVPTHDVFAHLLISTTP